MTSPPVCTRATVTSQRPDKMNAEPAPDRGYAPPQRVTAHPPEHTLGAALLRDALHHDLLAEVALRLHFVLASIHHVPFDTVCKLRDALTPGGVLVILGCYPKKTPIGLAWSLAAVPANAAARLSTAVIDNIHPAAATSPRTVKAPVKQPAIPLSEIRGEAAVLRQCCCPGAAFGPARGGS